MRRHATLLEVIVVMALIGLAASTVGVYAYRGMQQGRVQNAADIVSAKVNLAQQICLACDADVKLCLHCSDGTLTVGLEGDLPKGYEKVAAVTELKGIDHLVWERRKSDDLELPFTRHYHPRGELVLQGMQEDRTLMLRGYPSTTAGEEPPMETPQFPRELFSTAGGVACTLAGDALCFTSTPAPL